MINVDMVITLSKITCILALFVWSNRVNFRGNINVDCTRILSTAPFSCCYDVVAAIARSSLVFCNRLISVEAQMETYD